MKEFDPMEALERFYRSQDGLMAPASPQSRRSSTAVRPLRLATTFVAGMATVYVFAAFLLSAPLARPDSPGIQHQPQCRQEMLALAPGPGSMRVKPARRHTMLDRPLGVA